MVARTAVALMLLALVVVGGAVAVDDARDRAESNSNLDQDASDTLNATEDVSETGINLMQILIWPAAIGLVLGGVQLLGRL